MPGVLRVRLPDGTWQDLPGGPPGPPGRDAWPMVVQPNQPTAADYGEDTIPINAVWIQTPT